jgi:hypothetical protein
MDIVIIEGGFFKRPKAVGKGTSPSPLGTTDLRNPDTVCKVWGQSTKSIGKREVQVLRTWDGGPNRVRWVLSHRRKVAEGLHVHLPLFGNWCVC